MQSRVELLVVQGEDFAIGFRHRSGTARQARDHRQLAENISGLHHAEELVPDHQADFAIEQSLRAAPLPAGLARESEGSDDVAVAIDTAAIAQASAADGRKALAGQPGPVRDSLVSAAALCLFHLQRHDSLRAAADAVRAVLDNDSALKRFMYGA